MTSVFLHYNDDNDAGNYDRDNDDNINDRPSPLLLCLIYLNQISFGTLNCCVLVLKLFGCTSYLSPFIMPCIGPGSSVGMATDCGLDGPGSNPGEDENFHPSRPALGCRAVLWMPAHLIAFRTQQNCDQVLQELLDFLQRARWEFYRAARGKVSVGNYLIVIDDDKHQ